MKNPVNKRFRNLMVVLITSCLVTLFSLYEGASPPKKKFAEKLPIVLTEGGWSGHELEITQYEIDVLETDDLISREYVRSDDESIYLTVVFAQENRKVAHPPEVCLRGNGFEVEEKIVKDLGDGFKVIQLIVARGLNKDLYYYYFKSGSFLTENYVRQQLNIVRSHIIGGKGSASLIRAQTVIRNGDLVSAQNRLKEFTQELKPHVLRELP